MGFLDGLQSKVKNKNDKNLLKPAKKDFESDIEAISVLSEN